MGLESPATLSTLLCFGLDCPWSLTVPMMLNLTWAGKFGSLSNYCFVPAMPMEPPTKKRRYLKGMELAEADREQSPRGPPKSLRHFMPVACELAKAHAGSAYGNQYEMLVALNEVYGLVDSPLHMFKWPEPDQVKFEKAINKCLANYGWLAKEAFKQNRLAWSIVQKFHLLCHLPQLSAWLTPRHTWTYGSESFMGTMVHLAVACLRGTPPHDVPAMTMKKCKFFWHLLLKQLVVRDDV